MRYIIFVIVLFIAGCNDHCEINSTFYDNNKVHTLTQNIDCDSSIGIENITYNKESIIVKIERVFIKKDSLSRMLYFDNGNLKSTYFEVDNQKTGEHKKFFKNGAVRSVTSYLKGHRNGNCFEWNKDGTIRKQLNYKDGTIIQL